MFSLMNRSAITVRFVMALLTLVSTHLFAQQTRDQEIAQIVAQSQEALSQHNEQKALSFVRDGLVKFPNDENLQIQLARIYVEQKRDRQAIGLLNSILLANPTQPQRQTGAGADLWLSRKICRIRQALSRIARGER